MKISKVIYIFIDHYIVASSLVVLPFLFQISHQLFVLHLDSTDSFLSLLCPYHARQCPQKDAFLLCCYSAGEDSGVCASVFFICNDYNNKRAILVKIVEAMYHIGFFLPCHTNLHILKLCIGWVSVVSVDGGVWVCISQVLVDEEDCCFRFDHHSPKTFITPMFPNKPTYSRFPSTNCNPFYSCG